MSYERIKCVPLPGEEWRPVVEAEGLYSVSSIGRVRRDSDGIGKSRARAGDLLRLGRSTGGYPQVGLTLSSGRRVCRQIHILVAAAFIGSRPIGLQINHKDGNKTNNVPSNLEYVTAGENSDHAWRTGLTVARPGSKHHFAILNEEKVASMRRLRRRGLLVKDIAFLFSMEPPAVSLVTSGRRWKHVKDEVSDASIQ